MREVKRNKLGLGKLFHNYYLMTFFVCALFTYLPQYSNGTYLPYLFTEVMGDPSVIGTFTGIRAFMEAVSYTHLDVYKRQVEKSARNPSRGLLALHIVKPFLFGAVLRLDICICVYYIPL